MKFGRVALLVSVSGYKRCSEPLVCSEIRDAIVYHESRADPLSILCRNISQYMQPELPSFDANDKLSVWNYTVQKHLRFIKLRQGNDLEQLREIHQFKIQLSRPNGYRWIPPEARKTSTTTTTTTTSPSPWPEDDEDLHRKERNRRDFSDLNRIFKEKAKTTTTTLAPPSEVTVSSITPTPPVEGEQQVKSQSGSTYSFSQAFGLLRLMTPSMPFIPIGR